MLRAEALGLPAAEVPPFDLGFVARCVSLGRRSAVLQWTDPLDVARDRAWTGRAAVAAKWLQLRGLERAIGVERWRPGTMHWSGSGPAAHRDARPVAG